jgi:hypothetical protein
MPYPTKVEFVELLPLNFSGLYDYAIVLCVARETISFSLWVIGPSTAPVAFRLQASPPRDVTPICVVQDSQLGSHVSAHFCHLIAFIPQ